MKKKRKKPHDAPPRPRSPGTRRRTRRTTRCSRSPRRCAPTAAPSSRPSARAWASGTPRRATRCTPRASCSSTTRPRPCASRSPRALREPHGAESARARPRGGARDGGHRVGRADVRGRRGRVRRGRRAAWAPPDFTLECAGGGCTFDAPAVSLAVFLDNAQFAAIPETVPPPAVPTGPAVTAPSEKSAACRERARLCGLLVGVLGTVVLLGIT
ncbi:hypothetical protein B0H17DRAFT_325578 [Mycena rosella]|uniref:Uncharacterized protein n=1 Tax=Mycena rosella TaxID=1033263 RepID=A0AAD7DTC6_MYCRO|nr:hypothetical protein B0H17DRAFT_325578 [Mycena rosella]